MNNTETSITVPLGHEAHDWAKKFAAEQVKTEPSKLEQLKRDREQAKQARISRGKRVYLNTLAVYAVHSYLKWLQIETDLNSSDSWQPWRSLFDVADLVIPNLGKLECRPVLIGENVLSLPPEALQDRIGYIAVQFQEQLNQVQLLGFAPALDPLNLPKVIPLANLEPLENLLDYFYRLELGIEFLQSDNDLAVEVREG